jgi:hypothetical protein
LLNVTPNILRRGGPSPLDGERHAVGCRAPGRQQCGAGDPQQLGEQLAVLFEGATAMATFVNDTAPATHARAAAATLIDAAIGS